MATPTPGTQIKQYEIIAPIGAGGMATVYRAHHARLARDVAIKMMHSMFLTDRSFVARFEREAQVVAQLHHPNIVPIYDYDLYEGQPYLVMKLIDGRTLKDVLNDGALSLDQIMRILPPIADALTYAHTQGVLHRDIKPSNIIIDADGNAYLTDFGLARIAKAGESTMSADMLLGTPFYISPEQAQGGIDVDARADVYSLGVVLYELVVGRLPFVGDTPYIIVHKHIYEPPTTPSAINPQLPPEIEMVLLQALSKDPAARYPTPNALIAAFTDAIKRSGLAELDASRIQAAAAWRPKATDGVIGIPAAVGGDPGKHSAASGDFSSLFTQEALREIGQRFREVVTDIRAQLSEGERFENLRNEAKKAFVEIKTQVEQAVDESGEFRFSFGNDTNAKRRMIEREWGTGEDSIRHRVKERISAWRDLIVHVLVYLMVVGMLFFVAPSLMQFAVEMIGDERFNVLTSLNLAAIVGIFWGSGIIIHAIDVFYKTGSRLQRMRNTLNDAMTLRYGESWQTVANDREYKRVKKQVKERFERVANFYQHFVFTIGAIVVFHAAWQNPLMALVESLVEPETIPFGNLAYYPFLFACLLAVGLGVHAASVFFNVIFGDIAEERALRQELNNAHTLNKPKNDIFYEDAMPAVRLTEDGEFTETFVEQWADGEAKQKR